MSIAAPGPRTGRARGSSSRPLRIGVAGLGYWGPNLVRNLHDLEGATVGYICDLQSELVESVGRRYPAVTGTTSFETMISDPQLDAVVIATPISSHYALAKAALEAGKHVLVEKPLAASVEEGAQLIDLSERHGLVLMSGHTFLYSPAVLKIKGLIDVGELGDVYFVSTSRVNLGLHQPDVSVVWDLAPHDLSILFFWLEESPSRVSAMSRGCIIPDTPDIAFINLDYESGLLAHVELGWLAPSKLRRTAIVGSRKMVVYDDTSSEPVRLFDSGVVLREPSTFGEYRLTYRSGDIVSPQIDASEPLHAELLDFCDAIRTGSEPRSTARLGLEIVRVLEAVDASLARSGAPIEVRKTDLERGAPLLAKGGSRDGAG
jgi:predicted dehydrogenase